MSGLVVISNKNWQKIAGDVGDPLRIIGVVQLVPYGVVEDTA